MTAVLLRLGNRGMLQDWRSRDCSGAVASQGKKTKHCHQKPGRGKTGSLKVPCSLTSRLQNCERICFCYFKAPVCSSLWQQPLVINKDGYRLPIHLHGIVMKPQTHSCLKKTQCCTNARESYDPWCTGAQAGLIINLLEGFSPTPEGSQGWQLDFCIFL